MARFLIRNLRYGDIPELINLPRSEGREMGLDPEIRTWFDVDPRGIFVAENTDDGQIAGCCCGIALSENHGYIGMYVVKQQHRGIGLGRILWDSAIARLGNRNISLSTADKMLPFYKEKAGFVLNAEWTVDLYSTLTPIMPHDSATCSDPAPLAVMIDPEGPLVQYIIRYDSSIHQYDRTSIVQSTIKEEGTLTLMALRRFSDGRFETTGYACIKRSMQGHWLIAPVYADDYETAYSLVYGLMNSLSETQRQEGIVTKLISSNSEASQLFSKFGLRRSQYRLHRLFTKEVFKIPEGKVFALQSSVFCTE
ncbi:uncharacterized protein LOC129231229 [Uloborus diversus]|uniref:uncharacterized protein LOC129231229 n=1 Tax=Uloborus diversus TaxID=327109 RepID=UPI00240A339D|nr:uncharacterized protein LOC129231229 [Uloborus diversus]